MPNQVPGLPAEETDLGAVNQISTHKYFRPALGHWISVIVGS
jgi:hypothetical protein